MIKILTSLPSCITDHTPQSSFDLTWQRYNFSRVAQSARQFIWFTTWSSAKCIYLSHTWCDEWEPFLIRITIFATTGIDSKHTIDITSASLTPNSEQWCITIPRPPFGEDHPLGTDRTQPRLQSMTSTRIDRQNLRWPPPQPSWEFDQSISSSMKSKMTRGLPRWSVAIQLRGGGGVYIGTSLSIWKLANQIKLNQYPNYESQHLITYLKGSSRIHG